MSEVNQRKSNIDRDTFCEYLQVLKRTGKKFCFILGSGASLSSGIPTGQDMMKDWRSALLKESDDVLRRRCKQSEVPWDEWERIRKDDYSFPSEDYFTLYDLRYITDFETGREYLRNVMEKACPSKGYRLLAELMTKSPHNVVITTNFDHLIEDSFSQKQLGLLQVLDPRTASSMQGMPPKKPLVAKVHGDAMLDPLNRKEELKELHKTWVDKLPAIFAQYIPIVIGYGGGDQTLMGYLKNQCTWLHKVFWCSMKEEESDAIEQFLAAEDERYLVPMNRDGSPEETGFDGIMKEIYDALMPGQKPAQDEEPTPGKEPAQDEEPTPGKEPAQDEEPTPGKEPAQDEEPTPGKEPAQDEEPTPGKEPAQDEEPTPGKEPAQGSSEGNPVPWYKRPYIVTLLILVVLVISVFLAIGFVPSRWNNDQVISYNELRKLPYKESVETLVFQDTLKNAPAEGVSDISEHSFRNVLCWLDGNTLTIAGDGHLTAPKNCQELFKDWNALRTIEGADKLDTSSAENMREMFSGCSSLQSLDVSDWDTANVKDMNMMFDSCFDLQKLEVGNWKTSSVKDMGGMFHGCSVIQTLEVSDWNVANVEDMSKIFMDCANLQTLEVGKWKTGNVTDMSEMFSHCDSLEKLEVSNWNTTNVTNMREMFSNCIKLQSLVVNSWNVRKVTNMCNMFSNCTNIQLELSEGDWELDSIQYKGGMFDGTPLANNPPIS